jgi:putative zinc finger/helix-turn-helix YgiT family protein
MRCDICKGGLTTITDQLYHYTESGLDNVFLSNIEVEVCQECGAKSPSIPRIMDLHVAIARAIALQETQLHGRDARFLRKQLGLRAKEWAALIKVDAATLSRWENGNQQIGSQSDLLVRFLFIRLTEEREGRLFQGATTEQIASTHSSSNSAPIMVVDVETRFVSWYPSLEGVQERLKSMVAGGKKAAASALGTSLKGGLQHQRPKVGDTVGGAMVGHGSSRSLAMAKAA